MRAVGRILAFLTLALAVEARGQDKKSTPAAVEFKALLKEYQLASSSGKVLTDAERLEFLGRVYKHRDKLAAKFVELAEKNPKDPVAVDALLQAIWLVNNTPWPVEIVGNDERWLRAFDLLMRDHLASDKLGPACTRLSWGYRKEYEKFLRAVLDKNPHKEVQAQACLALAHYLTNRMQRIDLVKEEPRLAKEFADLFGEDYLKNLLRADPAQGEKEAEALFERAAKDFANVKLPGGDSVAERAKAELFELRHLVPGKEAPEIAGEDQDGKKFKLSDYRGKVVLLDFWSEY